MPGKFFVVQELDDTDDVNRKGVLRLATKCFNKMLEVDSSKWMQVFASISLVELDEQLMKVPNLSESEFGILHMIISTCMPGLEEVAKSVNYPKLFQLLYEVFLHQCFLLKNLLLQKF